MPNPLVLLIEDDSRLCDTISDLLQLLGIEYRVARNDTISRASLIALAPDLILLDLPLCSRRSYDLVTEVCRDFRLRQTKLVLIAADEYADTPECRLADVVLTKPFAVGELETALRRLLGQHHIPETMPPGAPFALQASSAQG